MSISVLRYRLGFRVIRHEQAGLIRLCVCMYALRLDAHELITLRYGYSTRKLISGPWDSTCGSKCGGELGFFDESSIPLLLQMSPTT